MANSIRIPIIMIVYIYIVIIATMIIVIVDGLSLGLFAGCACDCFLESKDQGPDVASRHDERREKAEEARFASEALDTHWELRLFAM